MKKVLFFLLLIFGYSILFSQIYEPEGINIPGSWDSWSNPPDNPVFASQKQAGGNVKLITGLATAHYQTVFSTPQDVAADSYEFLFTSGPSDDYWKNKWTDVAVSLNTVQTYTYHADGGGNNNTITLNAGKVYVLNFNDNNYTDTKAVFMELSSQPVDILSVMRSPSIPDSTQKDTVKIVLSDVACPEQLFYLRYTTDNWASSSLVKFSTGNDTVKAIIPPQKPDTKVEYYIFSTTIDNPSADFDLIAINFDNNSGENYSYTVAGALECASQTGVIVTDPVFPLEDGSITITFDATQGNGALTGYTGDVYAHTGVITSKSADDNEWLYIKTDWGENTPETKFTRVGDDLYQLTISNIRDYYGVPADEQILKIAMVIRSDQPISSDNPNEYYVARNADGSDFKIDVYSGQLAVKVIDPPKNDPLVPLNSLVPVCAYAFQQSSFSLLIDDSTVVTTDKDTIIYGISTPDYSPGMHTVVALATDGTSTVTDTTYFFIRPQVVYADLPQGVTNGINYIDDNTAVLVLEEPLAQKQYAFVIGDFNNWTVDTAFYMKKTPDGKYFWLKISGLEPKKEYAFQYYIDGKIKIADPYSQKILDPWNDKYISGYNYPNLKSYPYDKTKGIVSVLQTAQDVYQWQVPDFVPQAINDKQPNLVVYELLVRDFVKTSALKDVEKKLDYLDSLGINAIEIMPFNEFEGNISWGYNPDFYFAPDKYYGTAADYKHFIDQCHRHGIAVIMDIALNHSFGLCPLLALYWDSQNNLPAADNPWYNQYAPHPLSPGYDFNHESPYTKKFVKDILKYWLTEYNIDGFRFDLSKGFTQTQSGDLASWSAYDQSRVDILTDYFNYVKSVKPNAYLILEHLGSNDEEKVLAGNGMILWSNMNPQFTQASLGYSDNSDFSWAYYQNRDFAYPNNLVYMESHDEERLMHENLLYGNSSGDYNIKDLNTALDRIALTATFFFTIPGPKMFWQFGELGYDYGINYCSPGSYDESCRTSPKPVRWDYFSDPQRRKLYFTYLNLIKLRNSYDVFRTGNFSADLGGMGKRMWLSSNDFNVVVAGNFDVTAFDMMPGFQHTGTWYDYFTGKSFNVDDVNMSIHFEPGEYHIFTDAYVPIVQDNTANTTQLKETVAEGAEIYPVPAKNYLTINADALYTVRIYDNTGRKIIEKQMKNKTEIIDVSFLKSGVYVIKLSNASKSVTNKFIVQ